MMMFVLQRFQRQVKIILEGLHIRKTARTGNKVAQRPLLALPVNLDWRKWVRTKLVES